MTLLFLALAYFLGVSLGPWAWQSGLLGCTTPCRLWLLPLTLLPFTPLLNRLRDERAAVAAMRWPAHAGFQPVRPVLSPGLSAALLLCVALGLLRYAARPMTPCWTAHDLATYNLPADALFDRAAPQVTLQGAVASYPLTDDTRQSLVVAVAQMQADDGPQPVRGLVRVTTGSLAHYAYGQPVELTGRLAAPGQLDAFDYRAYLARQGVHSVMVDPQITRLDGPPQGAGWKRQVYALRASGEMVIQRSLPEPYAALANGILLGIGNAIPDSLYGEFTRTGASHVLVISGSNVALLAGAMIAFWGRILGKRRAWLPALLAIAFYAVLVGGEAAVVRAAVMGGLVVVATGLQRRNLALVSLAAACWAMTLTNPLALWDVGFQLSAAATAGLILLMPRITAAVKRFAPPTADSPRPRGLIVGLLVDGLAVSLAASLMVTPLLAYHFGRVSVLGLFANLLIVPVQPWVMAWGSAGVVAGVAGLAQVAQALLWIPWLGLVWTVWVVQRVAALPGASVMVTGFDATWPAASYGALALLLGRRHVAAWGRGAAAWLTSGSPWLVQPAVHGFLGVAAILVWWGVAVQPDGRLHVWFLDVDQGDGILIQTPSGRQVLVDGGRHPALLLSELGAAMPFWDRSLDLLVLTHPDGDHMDAQIEVAQRLDIGQAVTTAPTLDQAESALWQTALSARATPITPLHAGGWIDLGDGVALWVLWPPPVPVQGEQADNENSLVLKLAYGDFSLLLTGDAGLDSEQRWLGMGAPLASTVLKVGHHGSASGTGAAFVAAVNPQVAVIQVGENRYGHPTQTVLDTLAGRTVLRTDEMGRIRLITDGRQMSLSMERPSE